MTALGHKGAVDDGCESLPPQEVLATDGYFCGNAKSIISFDNLSSISI
jgi:hypothetical protein